MGDAGPLRPDLDLGPASGASGAEDAVNNLVPPLREVKILVTGFGQFKSFTINPSWLIAAALPPSLMPLPKPRSPCGTEHEDPASTILVQNGETVQTLSPEPLADSPSPKTRKYKITVIVHPVPVRVSYATAATLLPELIQQHDPDYILHIGMAAGREHYTLETVAHRDSYKIKDVEDRDGWKDGEFAWKKEGIPDSLYVGWDAEDVLRRWEATLKRLKEEEEAALTVVAGSTKEDSKKRVVKLSRDAGRFLCEFALFESLSRRWIDGQNTSPEKDADREKARERVGKVAFLHVPGGYAADDIRQGTKAAEAAIRALVESWEEGHRRKEGQEWLGVVGGKGVPGGAWEGVVWKG